MQRTGILSLLGLAAGFSLAGCGSGDLTLPGEAEAPSDVIMVAGDGQSARAGSELPASLVVRVVDQQGNPLPATTVVWSVEEGGGILAPVSAATDEQGLVSAQWTLGPAPGPNRANAAAPGVDPVTFSASGTGGGPRLGPDHLLFQVQPSDVHKGEPIAPPVVVAVVDRNGDLALDSRIRIAIELAKGSGKLRGKQEGYTEGGIVVFDDLELDKSGEGKVLRARAPEDGYLGAVESEPFDVRGD